MVHLNLYNFHICERCKVHVWILSLSLSVWMSSCSRTICWKDYPSLNYFCSFVTNQLIVLVGYICEVWFCSTDLCILLPIPLCLDYSSLVQWLGLKLYSTSPPTLFFFSSSSITTTTSSNRSLSFQVDFLINLSISTKWLAKIFVVSPWIYRSGWDDLTS